MGNDSTRRNDLPWNWRVPVRRQKNAPCFRAPAADTKANESRDPLQRTKLQTMWGEYVNAFEKATFVTDALGTLALLNVLAEELVGFQQSEVVGLHIGELLYTP
jgi:transcriptional regulator with PAS, ATPase and Fis domain